MTYADYKSVSADPGEGTVVIALGDGAVLELTKAQALELAKDIRAEAAYIEGGT